MRRVSTGRLEEIAATENARIELDRDAGIAVVKVGRNLFYAALEPGMEPCS